MRVFRAAAYLIASISLAGCFMDRCEWYPDTAVDTADATAETDR
jgi:hypothetical protein